MAKYFAFKDKPDEVHLLWFNEGVPSGECVKTLDGVEDDDISIVDKGLTCLDCIAEYQSRDIAHSEGQHCVDYAIDCLESLKSEAHRGACHHCDAKLQLPYDWRTHSPAPQVRRRETY